MDRNEFERRLKEEGTTYCKVGSTYIFPVQGPELRWLYELDVNATGWAFRDLPVYKDGKIVDFITALGG